ncbi:PIG-L family deacetylase [Oscillatoria sp. FACHB-1407]|uniref:PIG-L deacetylase family protein n=1 Tax=Oscillatoria sp. FACHB-1407 TaxID=2692847 RepID=UPI0016854BE4|nr:PIG-L deacetylase family protein [Oscillatoria sp. FACHB-1407]MBD2461881.1 PIG-L family deacetylase [Oscillatoria sp. FACHB-1407]
MTIKAYLKRLQSLFPDAWLEMLQYMHSNLIFWWILRSGSKPMTFNHKSVMVFSPHQDDETFGCGGMIALKRAHGIPVAVTFLTDGGAGGSLTDSTTSLVQIRKQEATQALEILGVDLSHIHFLDKPDGALPDLDDEERQKTVVQIADLLKVYQPGEVYIPHRKDCHRDHEATYELVQEAIAQAGIEVELLQYPIWLFWRAPLFIMLKLQDLAAAYHFAIAPVQEQKQLAIASYRSQLTGLPRGFTNRFRSANEIFFKVNL